ncbi:MAG: hypothetical protein NWE89_13695 [Candidatus Bathyarchaeota archaeon]|nr:hypothetical protein [Candidatus Bathyarchaeota archaeon]
MRRWRFIWALFTLYLVLQVIDITTTRYGIIHLGLIEDNPRVQDAMFLKGLEGGLLDMLGNNLSIVVLLLLLSNWKAGPAMAVVILGSFSFQFLPTVINNLTWIFFYRGLSYTELLPLSVFSYMLGGVVTVIYLIKMGDLDDINQDLRNWLMEWPLTRGYYEKS